MRRKPTFRWAMGGAVAIALAAAGPAAGQQNGFVIAGYGSADYQARFIDGTNTNDFAARLSPILLFQASEDVLFEAELELGLSGEETETNLEYAQVEYLGLEKFQFVAGKFLLPFGLFSERLHPTWINKLPSTPLLYGHAHSGVAEGALLPILSDAGLLVRFAQPVGGWKLDVSAWVTQGPRLVAETDVDEGEGDGHAHGSVAAGSRVAAAGNGGVAPQLSIVQAIDLPDVGYGVSFGDNNANKMLGGRVGLVRGGAFDAYFSAFHAMYDEDNFLDLTGYNFAAELRRGPVEVRGEVVLLRQEFAVDEFEFETVDRVGFYVQTSRRLGRFEPVARWSQLFDQKVDRVLVRDDVEQLAIGLDYWITPSVPVKVAWEGTWEGSLPRRDNLLVQWAFGF